MDDRAVVSIATPPLWRSLGAKDARRHLISPSTLSWRCLGPAVTCSCKACPGVHKKLDRPMPGFRQKLRKIWALEVRNRQGGIRLALDRSPWREHGPRDGFENNLSHSIGDRNVNCVLRHGDEVVETVEIRQLRRAVLTELFDGRTVSAQAERLRLQGPKRSCTRPPLVGLDRRSAAPQRTVASFSSERPGCSATVRIEFMGRFKVGTGDRGWQPLAREPEARGSRPSLW